MSTRVKYDLLPEGMHTFVYIDDPSCIDAHDRLCGAAGVEEVQRNAIIEVEDLNDPKSRRAHGVRQHLEGIGTKGSSGYQPPIATLLEEKPSPSKKGATSADAASAGVTKKT